MKTEVLKSIKDSEEDYKKTISTALDEKKRNIANAEVEAGNLIVKAQKDAEEYKNKRIADARSEAGIKYAKIVKDGGQRAEALNKSAAINLDKAVNLLVEQFKVKLNV